MRKSVILPHMNKLELPARATIEAFGGVCEMERKTGRAKTTISARLRSKTKTFPHWWTTDLQAIALRDGIDLPAPKRAKRRRPTTPESERNVA